MVNELSNKSSVQTQTSCLYVVNLQRNDDTNEVFDLLIAYMGRLQQEVSYKPNSISFAPLQVVNTSVA